MSIQNTIALTKSDFIDNLYTIYHILYMEKPSRFDSMLNNYLNFGDRAFIASAEYFYEDIIPTPRLIELLGLEFTELKPFAKQVIDKFENDEFIVDLKLGFWAYSQFQDILGVILEEDTAPVNRHYCYYESLVYLRESIISWLDGNILAALTIFRPFLELAVLHIYWHIYSETNGFKKYYKWLIEDKGKPPFKNQIRFISDNMSAKDFIPASKVELLSKTFLNFYRFGSAYNHSPKIDESIITLNYGMRSISLDGFYGFIAHLRILLRQIVYLYILAYPMIIFPVDPLKKWGFMGPMGVFIDSTGFSIIKKYLGDANIESLTGELEQMDIVKDLLAWYNEMPDLSKNDIEDSWNKVVRILECDKNIREIPMRLTARKAHLRSLKWALNYICEPKNVPEMPDDKLEKLFKKVQDWK